MTDAAEGTLELNIDLAAVIESEGLLSPGVLQHHDVRRIIDRALEND